MPDIFTASTKLMTASGVVGTSGIPTRIFSFQCTTTATTGDFNLRNGTTASGTIYIQRAVTKPANVDDNFGARGQLFPNGCYYELTGGGADSFTISYSQ